MAARNQFCTVVRDAKSDLSEQRVQDRRQIAGPEGRCEPPSLLDPGQLDTFPLVTVWTPSVFLDGAAALRFPALLGQAVISGKIQQA